MLKGSGFKDNIRVEEGNNQRSVVLRIKEANISYSDSGVSLMTIPDGAKIAFIEIDVTTGFDGTDPTYDIGFAANPDALVDGVSLPSTAGRVTAEPPAATVSEWNGVTDGELIGTFVGGGSNTAGAGVVKIGYYTDAE